MDNDVMLITRALDFAARKHVNQRRKGLAEEPYVNHLAEVALLLAEATAGQDVNLVIAGLLHDCIEDQGVRYEDLVKLFGEDVAGLVNEVSDDNFLPKEERKRLQVARAPYKSVRAKMLSIADKTANLRTLMISPPSKWTPERTREYFEWANRVVNGCRGVNAQLEARFDEAYRRDVL